MQLRSGKTFLKPNRLRPRRNRSGTTRRRIRSPRRRLRLNMSGARSRLRWFRQATILAVAMTGLLLILFAPGNADLSADNGSQLSDPLPHEPETQQTAKEAVGTVHRLWRDFYGNLPKIGVAIGILLLAWVLVRLIRSLLRRLLKRWERFNAATAVTTVAVWLLAIGIALSVLVGDIRALVGSLGLIGLALSWALQAPIESFTGWLLNSFKGYYRVGDRILIGDIFGDVYRIDVLTTTVWEIGDPHRPGFVMAEQPTGRLVTIPNSEVLTGTVYNLTRDFPYVWDELAVPIANESDLQYALTTLENLALELLKDYMVEPARLYGRLLSREGLEFAVPEEPQVFVAMSESWTDLSIRYLVGARERRKWKSLLSARVNEELRNPQHAGRIIPAYPRRQMQLIGPDGRPDSFR